MSDAVQEFLRAGLKHYTEAVQVTRRFQRHVQEAIEEFCRNGMDWKTFAPARGDSAIKTWAGGRDADGYWIGGTVEGTLRDKREAVVELGLWWDPPRVKEPLIAYTNFYEKPAELKHFKYEGTSRILAAVLMNRTRLYLVPNPDFDLDGDFRLLLDELQRVATSQGAATPV